MTGFAIKKGGNSKSENPSGKYVYSSNLSTTVL
jgi:hypothetical protein